MRTAGVPPADPAASRRRQQFGGVHSAAQCRPRNGDALEPVAGVLQRYELTRQHLRDDRELREQLAGHYWRANDAIRSRDYEAADAELEAIRALSVASPDVHMLMGAVERKVRRRR